MTKTAKDKEEAWNIQRLPDNGQPHGWIQWKGTNVCMDVHCECGELTHVDGDFAYHVKCSNCGAVYFCNGHIELIKLEKQPDSLVVETSISL